MKLLEYVKMCEDGAEITITDSEYDTETYVYNGEPCDNWDEAIQKLISKIEVVKVLESSVVVVDFTGLFEKHIEDFKKKDLFNSYDIDDIVCSIDNIISGYVSEKWLKNFVECLK